MMEKNISKFKRTAKNIIRKVMSCALCLSTFGGTIMIANAATLPDSVLEFPSSVGVPDMSNLITIDEDTFRYEWGEGGDGGYFVKTNDRGDMFVLPLGDLTNGFEIDDVITFYEDKCCKVDGRYIDLSLTIDKIDVGKQVANPSASTDTFCFARFMPDTKKFNLMSELSAEPAGTSIGVIFNQEYFDIYYTVNFTWSDTEETVDLPFNQIVSDLDVINETTGGAEGFKMPKTEFSRFYVYPISELTVEEDDDYVWFYASQYYNYTDDEGSYMKTGAVGVSNTGTFTGISTQNGRCGDALEFTSDYVNLEDPSKTVTSTGSNDDGSYKAGDEVEYTITQKMGKFYSDTYSKYNDLSFVDTLPSGVTYDSAIMYDDGTDVTDSAGKITYDSSSRTVTYTFDDDWLADENNYNGQTLKLVVKATVDANSEGSLTNTASTYFSNLEYGPSEATIEVKNPELTISKTADRSEYSVGDTINYQIEVTQTVADTASKNVQVTDSLPDGLIASGDPELSGADGDVSVDGNTVTATIPELEYNETAVITIPATVEASSAGKTVTNTATVTDDFENKETDTLATSVLKPVLSLSKTADHTTYSIGDTVTYTLTVNQLTEGTTAQNVVVTDAIPDKLELISVESEKGSVSTDGNTITVTYNSLAFNEPDTITVTAKALSAGEEITNTAKATADYADDVSDTYVISVRQAAISIEKQSDDDSYYPGDTATFTITIKNNDADAYNAVVSDTLPEGMTLLSVSEAGADGTVETDGDSFTVRYDKLLEDEESVITVTAQIGEDVDAGTLTNVATVSADSVDEISDYAEVNVVRPILSLVKVSDKDSYSLEDIVQYEITVKQVKEGATANNVVVTDTIPSGLSLQNVTLDGVEGNLSIDGNSITVTYDPLAFGETGIIKVTAEATEEGHITNTATATANYADPTEDSAEIDVLGPMLTLNKEAGSDSYGVTDTATYTITVNETTENAVAHNVVVSDDLPEDLKLTDVTLNGVEGEVEIDDNTFTVTYETLTDGDTAEISVEAEVLESAADKEITNVATVTSDNAGEATDDAVFKVLEPELSIEKSADKNQYKVDDTITYTIRVTETAEDASSFNNEITDEIPSGLTIEGTPELTGIEGEVKVDGQTVTATIPKLSYGEEAVLTIQVKAGQSLAGKKVTNTAMVGSDTVDPVSDNADVEIEKEAITASSVETSNPAKGDAVKTGEMIAGIVIAVVVITAAIFGILKLRKRKK